MWICVCDCIVPCGLPSQNRCIPRVGSGSTTKMNEWIIFSKLWDLPIWLGLVHTEINIYVQYLLDFPVCLCLLCTGICQYIYDQNVLEFANTSMFSMSWNSSMTMISMYWNSVICPCSVYTGIRQYAYDQYVLAATNMSMFSVYWNLLVMPHSVSTGICQ